MSQTLDMLLTADPAKVKKVPAGQIEIKRLSKELSQPFFIKFRAGSLDEMKEVGESANGNDAEEMKYTIYNLATDPDFKNKDLREKYGVARPVDIVSAILLGGEILSVYTAIMKLSGYDRNAGMDIEEVKN